MNKIFQILILFLGLWLGLDLAAHLLTEVSWFQEVGYLPTLLLRLQTQLGLWAIAGVTLAFFLSNLSLAQRFKHLSQDLEANNYSSLNLSKKLTAKKVNFSEDKRSVKKEYLNVTDSISKDLDSQLLIALNLPLLLLVAVTLSLLVGLVVINYGQVALSYWHPKSDFVPLPVGFPPEFVWFLGRQLISQTWQVALLLLLSALVLIYPEFILNAIAIVTSLCFGLIISAQWQKVLQFFQPTSFNYLEPLFNKDISFYIFKLPVWEVLEFWLFGLFLYTLISVTLVYLLSGNSLSQGIFIGFTLAQRRHLSGLWSCLMLSLALSYWLNRYQLLYSQNGITYGASYTEVTLELPAYTVLSILALGLSIFLLIRTIFPKRRRGYFLYFLGLYVVIAAIASSLLPTAVQRFVVQPNELARERPYIQRTIALTRQAFGLDKIEVEVFNPRGELTNTDLQANDLTVSNIRLWDTRPLLEANRQLQQIRLYYKFLNADLDRYMLAIGGAEDGETRGRGDAGTRGAEGDKEDIARSYQSTVVGAGVGVGLVSNSNLQPINSNQNPPLLNSSTIPVQNSSPVNSQQLTVNNSKTEKQQVIIAARELDYSAVPQQAKTWVNEHLIYTHGYGFTISPVNKVASGGLPDYLVKDIGVDAANGENETLWTANENVSKSIPIGYPRIYYGELADTYVMTGTKVPEFDYPSGNENISNTYDGNGGIAISSWWRRLLFAKYLDDFQMIFTQNFTPQTKLLFRRNIKERVRAIAPFLRYDSDPYLVVADIQTKERQGGHFSLLPATSQQSAGVGAGVGAGLVSNSNLQPINSKQNPPLLNLQPINSKQNPPLLNLQPINSKQNPPVQQSPNYLYWILDAYTISDRFPYSDPDSNTFNYIRNSVKVVIDAYNGSVQFYVADAEDPIIASWKAIFPELFKPLEAMPTVLRQHLRYPVDFFSIQSERLLTYHMTDAQVFYNREDQWQIPTEIYGDKPKSVEPYYLIMKLPTAKEEEFVLLLPFTPSQRTNLIGWLAARSDGEEYGKLLLYEFPKQQLAYGTEQIEALINQDPEISRQISLWNRQGSRAIQGNLLVIPIERSLLYVEPLYLEAEQNSLPTLVRVIVAYKDRIVMAETLQQALQAIFQAQKPVTPAIVRPVTEATP